MSKNMLGMNLQEWNVLSGLADPYSLELAQISAEAGVPHVLSEANGATNRRQQPQGQTTTGTATPGAAASAAQPTQPQGQTTTGTATPQSPGGQQATTTPQSGKRKQAKPQVDAPEQPGFFGMLKQKMRTPRNQGNLRTGLQGAGQIATGLTKTAMGIIKAPFNFARGAKYGWQASKNARATESIMLAWDWFLHEHGVTLDEYAAVYEDAVLREDHELIESFEHMAVAFDQWYEESFSRRSLTALAESIRHEVTR